MESAVQKICHMRTIGKVRALTGSEATTSANSVHMSATIVRPCGPGDSVFTG